ncbi:MAG TPA: hypothetical protein VF031_10570 [Alphaproteobacteria bacterium]
MRVIRANEKNGSLIIPRAEEHHARRGMVPLRAERIEAEHPVDPCQGPVGLPAIGQQPRETDGGAGLIWVQGQRRANVKLRILQLATFEQDHTERALAHGVVLIELHGFLRKRECLAQGFRRPVSPPVPQLHHREDRVGRRQAWIERDCPLQHLSSRVMLREFELENMRQAAQIALERVQVLWPFSPRCACAGIVDPARQGRDDGLRHFILHLEQVAEFTVIALRPYMFARGSLRQLSRYPDAVGGPAYAAFQDIVDAQLAADLPHIHRLVPVEEG